MDSLGMYLGSLGERTVKEITNIKFKDHEELARAFAIFYHMRNWFKDQDSKHIELLKKSISVSFPKEEEKNVASVSQNAPVDIFEFYKRENKGRDRKKILF